MIASTDYLSPLRCLQANRSIQARLEDGEYETMEKLEADLKRLVQNAKDFNATRSEVYEDAERIRKALSNFMPKHNPAYLDPNYRAYATPIPRELLDQDVTMQDATSEAAGNSAGKIVIKMRGNERRKSHVVSTEVDVDGDDGDISTAQLELLAELSALPDSE
jgi:Bromodomain